jgi:hypothetical protein
MGGLEEFAGCEHPFGARRFTTSLCLGDHYHFLNLQPGLWQAPNRVGYLIDKSLKIQNARHGFAMHTVIHLVTRVTRRVSYFFSWVAGFSTRIRSCAQQNYRMPV